MLEDGSLIQAARQGDLEAFNQLVLDYQNLVYRQAYTLLGDEEAAKDITQDTFIKAYRGLSKYRDGCFRVWLLRIATNACYDELRVRRRKQLLPLHAYDPDSEEENPLDYPVDPALSVEEQVERAELRTTLQHYIDELPVEFRTVLALVDILELDYAEAAKVLNIPIGTVKSRLARARLRMMQRLTEGYTYFPEPDHASSSISCFNPNGRISSQLVLPGSRRRP